MPLEIERLEQRIVLSGAVDTDHDGTNDAPEAAEAAAPAPAAPPAPAPADDHDPHLTDAADIRALLVSSDVREAETLAAAALDDVVAVFIDAEHDTTATILQKTQEALGGQQADSIAFATHAAGRDGLALTHDLVVNADTVNGSEELQAFWEAMGSLLADDGRIDLMACRLGSNAEGLALVDMLTDLTDHDVAASDDATGNADYADWILESDNVDLAATYFTWDHLQDVQDTLGAVWYVKPGASGSGNSWADAASLSDALDPITGSQAGEEIWLMAGVYKPATDAGFSVGDDKVLYGGFTGTETQRSGRDWDLNLTVLSGDLNGNGNIDGADARHVIAMSTGSTNVRIDGITITGGFADGAASPNYCGGGIYASNSCSFVVENCHIVNNVASEGSSNGWGGGLFANNPSAMTIRNSVFSGNDAYYQGGGIFVRDGDYTIENCVFSGNEIIGPSGEGGGIFARDVDADDHVVNCVFVGNTTAAGGHGGGAANGMFSGSSDPTFTNCLFANNEAEFGGGLSNDFSCSADIYNTIFWGNNATGANNQIYVSGGGDATIANSDVEGGSADIGGTHTYDASNVEVAPLFVGDVDNTGVLDQGNWNGSALTYNYNAGTTTLTAAAASWTANEHAGDFVRPDASSALQYYVVSNTATSVTVLGDLSSVGVSASFNLYDYHLQGSSPLVDQANPAAPGYATTDFNGQARENGPDLGPYEYHTPPAPPTDPPADDGGSDQENDAPYVPPPTESSTTDTSTDTGGETEVTTDSFEVGFDGDSDPLFESEIAVGDLTVAIGVADLGLQDGTEPATTETPADAADGEQATPEGADAPTDANAADQPADGANEPGAGETAAAGGGEAAIAKTPEFGAEPTPEPAPQPEPAVPDQPAAEPHTEPVQPIAEPQADLQEAIQDLDHAWDEAKPAAALETADTAAALLQQTDSPLDSTTATAVVEAVKTLDAAVHADVATATMADPVVATSLSMLQTQGAEAAPLVREVLMTATDAVAASLNAQPAVEAARQLIQTQAVEGKAATPVLEHLVEKVEASQQQLQAASQSLTKTLKAAAKGGGDRAAADAVAAAQASMHQAQRQLTVAYRVLQATSQSLQGLDPAGNRDAIASLRQAIAESRTLAMQLLAEAGDNPDPLTRDAVEALVDSMEHNAEKLATEVEIQKQAAETMQEMEAGQQTGAVPTGDTSANELAALAASFASAGVLATRNQPQDTQRKTA